MVTHMSVKTYPHVTQDISPRRNYAERSNLNPGRIAPLREPNRKVTRMFKWLKQGALDTTAIVNRAFDKAVEKTGAVLDGETATRLKESTVSAMSTAKDIGKNLTDLNGDGKVDVEDLKVAAEKAGVAWNSIDPDLKTALVAGGVAGVSVNVVPFVGHDPELAT